MTANAPRARLNVRLQPRARANEIIGERGGAMIVRVTALPLEGRANAALCELLAARLGVPKRSVSVVVGSSSHDKVVEVAGLSAEEVRQRLASD
jgi:uncharacterized protein YggU (UPF0235/DUF167 family)